MQLPWWFQIESPAEPPDLDLDGFETKSECVVKGAIEEREGGTIELLDDVAHLFLGPLPITHAMLVSCH